MKNVEKEFINSLIGIYNLEVMRILLQFLQGEQAVLFALSIKKVSSPTLLAKKLNLTKSRMSMIINSLYNKELIHLEKDLKDKRKVNVNLTKKGKIEIKEKEKTVLKLLSYLYEKLGDDKVRKLTKLINEVESIMKEVE